MTSEFAGIVSTIALLIATFLGVLFHIFLTHVLPKIKNKKLKNALEKFDKDLQTKLELVDSINLEPVAKEGLKTVIKQTAEIERKKLENGQK